jgi:hypothetical protein
MIPRRNELRPCCHSILHCSLFVGHPRSGYLVCRRTGFLCLQPPVSRLLMNRHAPGISPDIRRGFLQWLSTVTESPIEALLSVILFGLATGLLF